MRSGSTDVWDKVMVYASLKGAAPGGAHRSIHRHPSSWLRHCGLWIWANLPSPTTGTLLLNGDSKKLAQLRSTVVSTLFTLLATIKLRRLLTLHHNRVCIWNCKGWNHAMCPCPQSRQRGLLSEEIPARAPATRHWKSSLVRISMLTQPHSFAENENVEHWTQVENKSNKK